MAGLLSFQAARLGRALVWLRWRSLVNLLRASGRRGAGAAISAWGGTVLQAVLGLFGVVLAVVLAAAAAVAVWALVPATGAAVGSPGDGRAIALAGLRIGLAGVSLLVVVFAVIGGARSAATGTTRLLLLPVSTRQLHAMELLAGLGDPALLIVLPALLLLGGGTAILRPAGAAPALLAVGLVVAVLAVLATVVSFAVQLLFRDRRRAELAAVAAILAWVALSVLPATLGAGRRREARSEAPPAASAAAPDAAIVPAPSPNAPEVPAESERGSGPRDGGLARRVSEVFPVALRALPSEAFVRALAGATAGRTGDAGWGAAVLLLDLGLLYGLSLGLWRRLVASPARASGRRGAAAPPLPELRPPGLTTPAAAVAWTLVRGVWRTVLGRLSLFMPALAMAVSTATLMRAGLVAQDAFLAAWGAPLLAIGAVAFTVLSQQSILFNQFAVDGAGLTLELSGPVTDRDLVQGKAAGGAVLTAAALAPALLLVAVLVRGSSPLIWPAALLAGLSAYALLTPVAACLSIVLPKAVDLSRLGQGGKPHPGAALVGFATLPLALAPPAGLGAIALAGWRSPLLLLVVEALWLGAAVVLALPFLRATERLLARRREAILLTVRDRDS